MQVLTQIDQTTDTTKRTTLQAWNTRTERTERRASKARQTVRLSKAFQNWPQTVGRERQGVDKSLVIKRAFVPYSNRIAKPVKCFRSSLDLQGIA